VETSEKIVEAYVRYVKGWATIPNIRCGKQHEIDLMAVNPARPSERYHIEVSVSVSRAYSKLSDKEFDPSGLEDRTKQARQRTRIGYFVKHKFQQADVQRKLREYGFKQGVYKRVIVTWDWTGEAARSARSEGIELWKMRDLLRDLGELSGKTRSRSVDDTARTLQLFHRGMKEYEKEKRGRTG
jgi:hypothetical protein